MSASERLHVVDPVAVRPADLDHAIAWMRGGGIVAFPSDTHYALAVDASSKEAVLRLVELKRRKKPRAVPLVAASVAQVESAFGALQGRSAVLAHAFWPGPLALVLDAPEWVAPDVHAGLGSVAVRVPDHRVARMLAEAFGRPITATSANRSGAPPPCEANDLGDLLKNPDVFVVDGGATPGGESATVVDARGAVPVCVQPGAIAWDRVLTSP